MRLLRENGLSIVLVGMFLLAWAGQIVAGDVDWSKTRAYGLGFNGLYLNLAGREGRGIVAPADAEALRAEIAAGLEALRDPQGGARVVLRVDRAERVYSEQRRAEGPDLIVGYDSTRDVVSCGAGWDVVQYGVGDVIARDCERRIRVRG